MEKSLSTGKLAAIMAAPIAAVPAVILFSTGTPWYYSIASYLVFFIAANAFIFFMVQQFISGRIKLIYKLIYQTKASKKEEFYYNNILPQKPLDEVDTEVKEWAKEYSEEIDVLRKNEAYRKEFLLNLSHELKTPIFAIQGYTDTLLGGAIHNPQVNEKFLVNTAKNVDRLVNLVADLDEISKLEMGEQLLYKTSFIIQDLMKEVFEALSMKAEAKSIRCFIKKECEVPVAVYADKEKIRQVITNLVDNAIKYGKHNGEVEGSAYKVEGKKVLIEITDNGYGISEEHLPRIFERFYRTDEARARKVGGSGLGLSICKHIIEAHGESIHVRSKVDVGTSFGFMLQSVKGT
jgi:two-component system, OmpR family, phosphate regulon sensor histidine kinase PhoR